MHIRLPRRSMRDCGLRYLPALAVMGIALLGIVAGCSGSDGLGPWKEEVKLSDGRVIVVERSENFDIRRPIGDPGSAFIDETRIKVVRPAELATLPELVVRGRPIIFDYDADAQAWFVIVVNDHACGGDAHRAGHMNAKGTVNLHPNREFRLVDGAWKEVDVSPDRIGTKANLLIQRTTIDQFDVLPLSEKARVDFDNAIPKQFRQVEPHIGCR